MFSVIYGVHNQKLTDVKISNRQKYHLVGEYWKIVAFRKNLLFIFGSCKSVSNFA